MLARERPLKAQPPRAHGSDVVHARAEQGPVARLGLLREREHVNVVVPREALDEPEERGDDALGSALVHAAGRHESESHGAWSFTVAGNTVDTDPVCSFMRPVARLPADI